MSFVLEWWPQLNQIWCKNNKINTVQSRRRQSSQTWIVLVHLYRASPFDDTRDARLPRTDTNLAFGRHLSRDLSYKRLLEFVLQKFFDVLIETLGIALFCVGQETETRNARRAEKVFESSQANTSCVQISTLKLFDCRYERNRNFLVFCDKWPNDWISECNVDIISNLRWRDGWAVWQLWADPTFANWLSRKQFQTSMCLTLG